MSGRTQRKVPFFICSFVFPRLLVCLFILTQGQVTPDTLLHSMQKTVHTKPFTPTHYNLQPTPQRVEWGQSRDRGTEGEMRREGRGNSRKGELGFGLKNTPEPPHTHTNSVTIISPSLDSSLDEEGLVIGGTEIDGLEIAASEIAA